jgi:hypothetical protein
LEGQGNNQQFRQGILAAAFLVLLIGGSIGMGISGGSPSPSTTTKGCPTTSTYSDLQCGTVDVPITMNGGEPLGTTIISFNPVFPSIPRVFVATNSPGGADERSWTISTATTPNVWTAQPTAVTELFGRTDNRWVMLWGSSSVMNFTCTLAVNVIIAGNAGSVLRVQESPDQTTWTNLQSSQGDVATSSTGLNVNGWANLGNGGLGENHAPTGPYYRVVGQGGNGVISPQLGNIYFECWWNLGFGAALIPNPPTASSVSISAIVITPVSSPPNTIIVKVYWEACTKGC